MCHLQHPEVVININKHYCRSLWGEIHCRSKHRTGHADASSGDGRPASEFHRRYFDGKQSSCNRT